MRLPLEVSLSYRQAYISQHLMVLREAGVAQDRREGWNIFYRVIRPEILQIVAAVSQLLRPIEKPRATRRVPKVPCRCPQCHPGSVPLPSSPELANRRDKEITRS